MKIFGIICVRDESSRYLDSCLSWMNEIVDQIFVYDDRSIDSSVGIAIKNNCEVVVRPRDVPSFMEHEGLFRQAAWDAFEQCMSPELGDWIVAFDSDEFLLSDSNSDIRNSLNNSIKYAEQNGNTAIMIHFSEVFKINLDKIFIRVDGFWPDINGPRIFAYKPGASWSNKSMGCGSQPEYVNRGSISKKTFGLEMLHFGYALDDDKNIKYNRYTSLYNHGHSNKHIESIITIPTLIEWNGIVPKLN